MKIKNRIRNTILFFCVILLIGLVFSLAYVLTIYHKYGAETFEKKENKQMCLKDIKNVKCSIISYAKDDLVILECSDPFWNGYVRKDKLIECDED